MARYVVVVVNVEVANVQDLAEDTMQLAVAAPWVAWSNRKENMSINEWNDYEYWNAVLNSYTNLVCASIASSNITKLGSKQGRGRSEISATTANTW